MATCQRHYSIWHALCMDCGFIFFTTPDIQSTSFMILQSTPDKFNIERLLELHYNKKKLLLLARTQLTSEEFLFQILKSMWAHNSIEHNHHLITNRNKWKKQSKYEYAFAHSFSAILLRQIWNSSKSCLLGQDFTQKTPH